MSKVVFSFPFQVVWQPFCGFGLYNRFVSLAHVSMLMLRQAQIDKLEAKIKRYYKVPRMSADEELHVMKDFTQDELTLNIKKELTNTLKRKNAKRNFIQVLKNDEDLYEYWLIFKAKWYQEWVRGYLLDVYRY